MFTTMNVDDTRDEQAASIDSAIEAGSGSIWPIAALCLFALILTTIAATIVLALIPVYLPAKQATVKDTTWNNCVREKTNSPYDYIVIGSGPGGATIATRLALNNFQVLLIEAGPDYDGGDTMTPAFQALARANPAITINFYPYLYSKEENIKIQYPRGSLLGGCSQNNAMVPIPPSPLEWDYIAQVTNDKTWNSENIENNYRPLIENCEYCSNNDNDKNKNGWLNISIAAYQNPSLLFNSTNSVLNDLFKTVNSQLKFNPNINANNSYDSWLYIPEAVNQNSGIRSSAYRRVKNVQSIRQSNFHIWTNSFVTKLIINPQTKETCGVEYINGSNLYKASSFASQSLNSNNLQKSAIYAKREIIVSGGQWMTPQLLQLSGIGDRDLLSKFGIKTIQHLPGVGKNQQEQSEISYIVKLKPNGNLFQNTLNCTFNSTRNDPCLIDYNNNPRASFYATNLAILAVLRSAAPLVPNLPDSTILFIPQYFTGFRANAMQKGAQDPLGTYLTVDIELGNTRINLGTVAIQSTNAFDTPLIEINHFKGENGSVELNQLIQHIRFSRQLLLNTAFSQYVDYEDFPGSQYQTDEQLSEFIREWVWGHHACCTTKMGNIETDPYAVLNSKAQVKGIKNLRICDISMFPREPGHYPMVPIMVACEKIADDITKDAKR